MKKTYKAELSSCKKWLISIFLITFTSSVPFVYASEKNTKEGNIEWRNNLEQAKKEAQESNKLIFFFFHHPMCSGCKKIITDTLPDIHVKNTLEGEFVPLTYLVTEAKDLVQHYKIDWTPTFILADEKGQEQDRWVGFLPANDFLAQVALSEGHVAFKKEDFNKAQTCFKKVLKEFPKSGFAPEARYFLGVSQYKATHDSSHLKETWKDMKKSYPEDSWTKKASAWGG
jgi:thioredoxin-related protein